MATDKIPFGSTTLVSGARFRPHGRVDMMMENDVLQYEATGPFNAEVFDALAVAQADFLKSLTLAPRWASICTLRISAMASPEGIARYTELMQRAKPTAFEPVATAFVVASQVEGCKIMAPHFAKIYTLIGRPFRIFETMEPAQLWVRSMISQQPTPL